jgi:hypothetical protein
MAGAGALYLASLLLGRRRAPSVDTPPKPPSVTPFMMAIAAAALAVVLTTACVVPSTWCDPFDRGLFIYAIVLLGFLLLHGGCERWMMHRRAAIAGLRGFDVLQDKQQPQLPNPARGSNQRESQLQSESDRSHILPTDPARPMHS